MAPKALDVIAQQLGGALNRKTPTGVPSITIPTEEKTQPGDLWTEQRGKGRCWVLQFDRGRKSFKVKKVALDWAKTFYPNGRHLNCPVPAAS